MKWFKHDANANTDVKLKKLRHKYGIQGYGLYWYCVELIAGTISSDNITFELEEDAEVIALEWNMDQLKVQEIISYMVEVGLFDLSQDNKIRCLKLAKRLDDTNSKNPEIKKILNKINTIDSFNTGQKESEKIKDDTGNSEKLRETPNQSEQTTLDKIRLDNNTYAHESADESAYIPTCPHQAIIDLYHKRLPMLRKVKVWNEQRQALLKTRWREDAVRQELDWWDRFFQYIAKLDFLCGRSGDWQADLEWIVRPANFIKIIEGKYDNREVTA